MAFIEPMHRNKPNITYLLTYNLQGVVSVSLLMKICSPVRFGVHIGSLFPMDTRHYENLLGDHNVVLRHVSAGVLAALAA